MIAHRVESLISEVEAPVEKLRRTLLAAPAPSVGRTVIVRMPLAFTNRAHAKSPRVAQGRGGRRPLHRPACLHSLLEGRRRRRRSAGACTAGAIIGARAVIVRIVVIGAGSGRSRYSRAEGCKGHPSISSAPCVAWTPAAAPSPARTTAPTGPTVPASAAVPAGAATPPHFGDRGCLRYIRLGARQAWTCDGGACLFSTHR